MYTRILVPLDGSERAERAVPIASRLARFSGCHITLLQVVSRPAPLSGTYVPQSTSASWIEQDVAAARAYLAHVAGWPLLNGLSVETRVVVGGAPAATILDVAKADGAELIVLCSHGRTGPARWLLGSVAEHIARNAPVPVLVLREQGAGQGTTARGPQDEPNRSSTMLALVSLDGSSFAEAALEPAAHLMLAFAGLNRAAIHLALVLPPAEAGAAGTIAENRALHGVRIYLMRVADRLRALYPRLDVGWSIIPGHNAAKALLGIVGSEEPTRASGDSGGYTLIAMATHGRSGVSRLAFGSVTEQVLHHSHLPLLVVRPGVTQTQQQAQRTEQAGGTAQSTEHIPVTGGEAETLWTPLF